MDDTVSQQIYEQLRRKLSRGELPAGAHLVNRTLAAELGVSFTPVREAINRLASEGLIEYVRGSGAYVRRPSGEELAQLYDLREQIDSYAAAQASQHATDADLDELQTIGDEWFALAEAIRADGRATANPTEIAHWLDLAERFEAIIGRSVRNPWLSKTADDLRTAAMSFTLALTGRDPDSFTSARALDVWRERTGLLQALRRRSPEQSRLLALHAVQAERKRALEDFAKHQPTPAEKPTKP